MLATRKIMFINGKKVKGKFFAYDGCHKIYVCENNKNCREALASGYKILPINELQTTYENSCELRFIRNWNLTKQYVTQFENAEFKFEKEVQ